ncbi:hypothetical protein TVAG_049820 [Trichomonas vaginalis G3]|uniref:DUF4042 domain-containing protein n=1 Tax=Trichomonas vaginalis (strain ATCC PRA-98 / G3) TaxID=412133 RepID=A2EVX7_TRIV3|nr:malaria antigen-related family [Trichomonas vaginalis G3]EAY03198.1 hypothetical protein TVAG_049820 [Trichomonas vaginalis G3]KAI5520349.1 malaria antigen-related family [Trichomonas vaginalis G3]|eukprot:XP_001315421.1 hypothetical protein [Trichomonas vaginalis G3]
MHRQPKVTAEDLIDEFIDNHDRQSIKCERIQNVIQQLQNKDIESKEATEIGDLLATLAEIIPPIPSILTKFCDAIASICVDKKFLQFTDEAITTVVSILITQNKNFKNDPSPILRAISSILYGNTLRLKAFHDELLTLCHTQYTISEEAYRRAITIIGNISAFSGKSLDVSIYIKSIRFLTQAIATNNIEIQKPALRALQLTVLDAPPRTFDLPSITSLVSAIVFAHGPVPLRYEAIMVLKALASATSNAFYSQWPILLTGKTSVFDLFSVHSRIAKTSADLLAEMFTGAYSYMKIANNIDTIHAFTTLASQIGEIIDICFIRFFDVLNRTPRIDSAAWSKTAHAFAIFVKDVSFDSGHLKSGYLTRVVKWAESNIKENPDESLAVLKSLLWTSIENEEFKNSFDFIFNSFLANMKSENPDTSKTVSQAMRRIAYAYSSECVSRWSVLNPVLKESGAVAAFQVISRLAINKIDDINIWNDIITFYVPLAFETGNKTAVKLALECIGHSSFIFSSLPDSLQRTCLSTVLANDNESAYEAIGLLADSSAPEYSSTFLCEAYIKLSTANPPQLCPLSKVLKVFSTNYKEQFEKSWKDDVVRISTTNTSPYSAACLAYVLPFMDDQFERDAALEQILKVMDNSNDAETKWEAAASLSSAARYGYLNHKCCESLLNAMTESKSPKLRVNCAIALSELTNRIVLGDLFVKCVTVSVEFLKEPAHFTFLKLDEQRKLDGQMRSAITVFFFKLIKWSVPKDFNSMEEVLVTNSEMIYELMLYSDDAPWESITRLYELKFTSIPADLLEKFQAKAFPV